MKVLVTGATGFIGRHVVAELRKRGIKVRIACRQGVEYSRPFDEVECAYLTGRGTDSDDWIDAVTNCTAVVHLAARAHILRDLQVDSKQAFRIANIDFARACAEAAVNAGVRRFIFMSSVGVHGGTSGVHPIHERSDICPHTPYATSKAEAEQVITEIARGSNMELTVLRPPLVYGFGAPGNFALLVRAISCGYPLPLGSVTSNRRSFVAIDNLVDLIVTCLNHPSAANKTFLVSDGEDISTTEFLRRLGSAIGKPTRLVRVPLSWLNFGSRLFHKTVMFNSLCCSLQIDISKTQQLLEWNPPIGMEEGLKKAMGRNLC